MSDQALKTVSMLLSALEIAANAGVNAAALAQAFQIARNEGRELTDEELKVFADAAQSSIDAARDA